MDSPEIILSILTPSIPERTLHLSRLQSQLEAQIGGLPVEHLAFSDNMRRSIGRKRDGLLRLARGKYVAFVDDDDWIDSEYVGKILTAAGENPDVITFQQEATVDGRKGVVEFRLGNPDEPFKPGGITKRNAWHVVAWRRSLAIGSGFPDSNYGEDRAYSAPLCKVAGLKEIHIPSVLHFYTYDSKISRAKP
jgi:glycosyltransferase involved in cell wall biosynthesis